MPRQNPAAAESVLHGSLPMAWLSESKAAHGCVGLRPLQGTVPVMNSSYDDLHNYELVNHELLTSVPSPASQ